MSGAAVCAACRGEMRGECGRIKAIKVTPTIYVGFKELIASECVKIVEKWI